MVSRSSCHIKIIFALLIKVVKLYIQAFIVQVGISSLYDSILRCKVFLVIFLFLTNNFKANLLVFYRFILVYITGKARIKARFWAKIRVWARKTVVEGGKMLFPLVEAFEILSASLSCHQVENFSKYMGRS